MNLDQILRTKIVPGLRSVYGQDNVIFSSEPRIPGVSGSVLLPHGIKRSFHIWESQDGINLTCSCNNVSFGDEKYFMESPETLWDYMTAYLSSHNDVPVEGRTWTRTEDLERRYGTLTGLNRDALIKDDNIDEITENEVTPPRLITA